jgi:dCMP deaminase
MRISKDEYYLGIAEAVSRRSTCLRIHYGSVMVKHDRIISTGYNGSPTGAPNCDEIGECYRVKNNIPHFTRYETCESVHSEMNAIINASRPDMIDSTLYLVGKDASSETFVEADCCPMCRRAIINAGIKQVVFRTKDGGMRKIYVSSWKNECGFSNKE